MRLLLTVTLNPNQLRAHLEPLTDLDEVQGVTLVADQPQPPMAKLRVVVPPSWLSRLVGRAAAKLLVGVLVAVRERPHWILGYNIVPHGINAVAIARLTRRRGLVHVIGGPVEWEGGGHGSSNAVLSRLPGPSRTIERLLLGLLRSADAVAVMGSRARADLLARGLRPERVTVIPASVDAHRFRPAAARTGEYDLVTACRLIPIKRLGDFLAAVALLRRDHPGLKAAIAGTGPMREELEAEARRLGVEDAVDFLGFVGDVERVYASSRIFMLTSLREGLSIAMTEAMASGLPVIATDVGEARDVIVPGCNGYLVAVGDVEALAARASELLADEDRRRAMAVEAVEAARRSSSRASITELNRRILDL
jgi:glycosyltransferase involved in cell wall biosynthesis